jgi:hypothetical protein
MSLSISLYELRRLRKFLEYLEAYESRDVEADEWKDFVSVMESDKALNRLAESFLYVMNRIMRLMKMATNYVIVFAISVPMPNLQRLFGVTGFAQPVKMNMIMNPKSGWVLKDMRQKHMFILLKIKREMK